MDGNGSKTTNPDDRHLGVLVRRPGSAHGGTPLSERVRKVQERFSGEPLLESQRRLRAAGLGAALQKAG